MEFIEIRMKQNSTVKEQSLNPQNRPSVSLKPAPAMNSLDDECMRRCTLPPRKKAIDPVVLDLREIASFTDYFIIVSGANERQVQAISDEVYEQLKKAGSPAARVEGYKTAEWILLDYGDFVVHVFEQKARQFLRP
jgi:ribosome-associated protein